MKIVSFTVEGSGEFPFDMLRYDSCWPLSQDDVREMAAVNWTRQNAPEEYEYLKDDIISVNEAYTEIPEDIMKVAFGDHVLLKITREGITTEELEHE